MRYAAPVVTLFSLLAAGLSGCDMNAAYRDSFAFSPVPASAPRASTLSAVHGASVSRLPPAPRSVSAAPRLAGSPITLADDANFTRELSGSPVPVVINFTARWCGPCHSLQPVLDGVVTEQGGRVKLIRVDFDQSPATVRKYNISALPAMLMVKNGVVVKRMVGMQQRETLSSAVAELLR